MKNNNVLIIVAHSDDETIGMGGTIKKHVNNKDNVYAISMTDGVSARDNPSKKQIHSNEASKASLLLANGKTFNIWTHQILPNVKN